MQIRGLKVTNWKDMEGGELGEIRYFEKQKKKKKKKGAPDFGLRQAGDPDFTTMSVRRGKRKRSGGGVDGWGGRGDMRVANALTHVYSGAPGVGISAQGAGRMRGAGAGGTE